MSDNIMLTRSSYTFLVGVFFCSIFPPILLWDLKLIEKKNRKTKMQNLGIFGREFNGAVKYFGRI